MRTDTPRLTILIVIDLCCDREHRFEGWFASAEAFEKQRQDGLVSCPVCGTTELRRLPSAPYVQTRTAATEPPQRAPDLSSGHPLPADAVALLKSALREAARKADDVGDRFPAEARRMHHGEIEARSIRGAATRDELGELIDEGIVVLPVPPDDDLH